jgi:hypothetical protein
VAQRVQVLLICDLDDNDEGVKTVTFGFDGDDFAIELCEAHRHQLASALGEYIGAARFERGGARRARAAKPAPSLKAGLGDVRDWARANGYEVSNRGRLPAAVRDAYQAASR